MTEYLKKGDAVNAVLAEVRQERSAQDAKWGEQNHPNGTGEEYLELADRARAIAGMAAAEGILTWEKILLEEAFEACAEKDAKTLRKELVQVAAVAVAWIEAIDRKGALEEACPPTVRATGDYPYGAS